MSYLPPIPSWDGLHPLIIHFPIVLLLFAPLLIVIAAAMPASTGRYIYFTALGVMALGTVTAFVSYQTGEAAAKLAERTPEISAALERHEHLAETTRLLFSILTVLFAGILSIPKLFKIEPSRSVIVAVSLVFLFFYGSAAVVLVNTAHQGGMLVHQYGVRALVGPDFNNTITTPHEGD